MNRFHTYLNRTASRIYKVAPFHGLAGRIFTGVILGLVPDSIADVARQAFTLILPRVRISPADAVPYLLRTFGLPSYPGETYAQALERCADAWATHARAGTPLGIETELLRAGFTGTVIEYPDTLAIDPDAYTSDFWVEITDPPVTYTPSPVYGSVVYGEFIYGVTGITRQQAITIRNVVRYWKNGRTRYRGIVPEGVV